MPQTNDSTHDTINSPAQLAELCERLSSAKRIGFDTEFVSEDTFRPELCLVQVAADGLLAVIDPYEVGDLTPFWRLLADGDHVTLAHAAREEINFSLEAIGAPPANLFDTQLAAAFCAAEYPAAYSSVVTRFLGIRPEKGEQRTDWRRRPLTTDQINYALEDVRYLDALHDAIGGEVEKLGRTQWLADETAGFVQEVTEARGRERWRRVSGIGNLGPRNLAVVRELWRWRQAEAERRNLPPKRVLRDDLIAEIAKRKLSSADKIKAIRGMQHGQLKKATDEIAACVQCGLEASLDGIRGGSRKPPPPQLNLLGQFLAPAVNSICREQNIAASLVGSATDLRELIAERLGFASPEDDPPALACGWRAELIGNLIDDLLAGKTSIRISNPRSEHPLSIDGL
ncbi:Ribonuclease D [Pirellulimonas nuda]|uniref:Ribonuclease D n=1 Tax=Pirellulimonas nuda TaxID=2528009 RepID=A0A518D850_9BACT|nr:HRDC domain-containing protein [Pirellulimonas nuda]QDU87661.1 Ribonuclease D [Pirellulimonas nuda]